MDMYLKELPHYCPIQTKGYSAISPRQQIELICLMRDETLFLYNFNLKWKNICCFLRATMFI